MKCLNNKGKMSLIIALLLAGSLSIGSNIINDDKEPKENIEKTHVEKVAEKNKKEDVIYNNSIPDEVIVEIKTHEEKEKIIHQMKLEQEKKDAKKLNGRIKSLSENNNDKEDKSFRRKLDLYDSESSTQKNSMNFNSNEFKRYALHDIAMPIKHQKYLYKLCKEKGLNYIKTLAILKHESQFDANLIHSNRNGTKDYGYMQVNSCNHENFAKELGTPIDPLDPYINLEWGTHELQKLKGYYSEQGLTGVELFEAIQSAYNKGIYGFKKHGKAERYIERTNKELNWLKDKLNL